MRPIQRFLFLSLATGMAAACGGGDDATGPALPNIVGGWRATTAQVTNKSNAAQQIELIGQGASIIITFNSNHTYAVVAAFPGEPADNESGTYVQTATAFTITETGSQDVRTFTYTLSGNTLTAGGATIAFDFGAGDVPSTLNLVLVKQ
jgi:hypothetical protein